MSEKPTNRKSLKASEPDMRAEYDFSGAVRGKHYKQYVRGSNVVVLEPDVAKGFKSSAAVNKVLRDYLKSAKRGLTAPAAAAIRKRVTAK